MKVTLLLLLAALPLFPQPGIPTSVFAGKLTCSARMYSPTQVQTWCLKGTKLVHNTLQDITKGGSLVEYFGDGTPNEPYASITWFFYYDTGLIRWEATYHVGQVVSTQLLTGTLAPAK